MSLFLGGKSRLQYFYQRIHRTLQILRTPYRNLLLGNTALLRAKFDTPALEMISIEDSWHILKIGDFRFYWPNEYEKKDLKSLYHDTFASAKRNPHAFEVGDVHICPGDWVVDAGACEGFFSYYALMRGANVLIIEPVTRLAEALSLTFKKQISDGRVYVLNGALGDSPGVTKLMIPNHSPIGATTDLSWEVNAEWQRVKLEPSEKSEINVRVYTLDEIYNDRILPSIDFVKIDIENNEIGAIRGAKNILRFQMPKLSIAVYHDFLNAKIIKTFILKVQPQYHVRWRGVFIRDGYGPPRPYMLYANV